MPRAQIKPVSGQIVLAEFTTQVRHDDEIGALATLQRYAQETSRPAGSVRILIQDPKSWIWHEHRA